MPSQTPDLVANVLSEFLAKRLRLSLVTDNPSTYSQGHAMYDNTQLFIAGQWVDAGG